MNKITSFTIFCMLILFGMVYSQDKITINHADSLVGRIIEGEQVREAIGNVSLTHNNIKSTAQGLFSFLTRIKQTCTEM